MTMEEVYSIEWINEKVEKIPHYNWFYKLICFLMGKKKKKFSYLDLFLVIYGIHRDKIGEKEAKEVSLNTAIKIYEFNNNRKPNIYKNNDEKK